MILITVLVVSLFVMVAQYSYDLITSIPAGNILMLGILLIQAIAIYIQIRTWRNKRNECAMRIIFFLYGFACGLFWSVCMAYGEGLTLAMLNHVHIINFIIISAVCGGACMLIAAVLNKKLWIKHL